MSHPKIRLLDRAKETTNTTGSGTIALAGPVNGFVAISGIGNGNSSYYTIEEGVNYEVGIGTYVSAGNALSRDQVFSSSNSNYRINLQGSGTVFITYPADKAVVVSSGNLVGIGEVIDPEYQLHVSGTGSFDTVRTNVLTPSTNADTITISGNIVSDTGHLSTSNLTSIGYLAGYTASGARSILIGNLAGTGYRNPEDIAIGYRVAGPANLTGGIGGSVAIGTYAKSYIYSTIVGQGTDDSTFQGGLYSAGLGYKVFVGVSGARIVGVGSYAGKTNASQYSDSIAIGYNSYLAGDYGISIGSYANSTSAGNNPKSIAIGYSSRADSYGVAIGCHTIANDNNFVLGTGSSTTDVMLSGVWGSSLAVLNSRFGINKSSPLAMLHIGCDSATAIGGLIDAAPSQVAALSLWRNSSTASIAAVDSMGGFISYNTHMTAPTGRFATSLSGLWQDQLSFTDNTIRVGTGCATLTNPQSVFIGYAAGSGIQSPCTHNIVIGNEAGYTSSGQYNTLIGSEAGENATGDYNIFLGSEAGLGASGTNYTICIGNEAGKNTPNTCTTNTIIGSQAGENMSGSYCVLLGPNAGKRLIGGAGATVGGSDWSVGLGLQALQDGSGYGTIGLGLSAGNTSRAARSIYIGYQAGYSAAGNYITSLGDLAGRNSSGENNIFIGQNAGWACTGNNNIEIVSEASAASILTSNSNKIHIENTIVGDTSNKKIAIGNVGVADVSPDATLEVKPNASTHVGFIVQGAASQTANLTEWQNSSESVVANVDPSGRIYASGGLLLETGIPAVTTNTIYNSGGVLFFNGSGINEVPPGGSTFTAGTGLLLVGNEFNTAKTGHFDAITFNNIAHIDTSGNATFANITTTGNLNVSGTLTYIDSTTVTIADKQLELASNSGTAAGNDAYVDDGGIVLKSTEGDKKWTWQNNAYWDEWLSSEHVGIAADKALRLGPTCAGSPGRLITFNWTNRGNLFLGNPGALTVPSHASGWLIMNHGDEHGGGVITGVHTIDARSGNFKELSISGTPMTFSSVGGEAKLGGLGSLSVLPDGASAPLEIKGASNAYISFPDGTSQSTAPTGDIAIVSGLVVSNTGDIATVSGLTVTNASNIGTTGTTFVNATGTLVTNLASTGTTLAASIATNTGDIATVSGLTVTNASNIGTTGTTFVNATGTLVTNLASTGTTLAASIATNATNIATNTGDIATVSGLVTTYTAGTGLTLVGTEFNTAGTGNFSSVAIGTDGYIYHSGDTDTYIQFTDDEIQIAAGGRTYIKIEEDSVDKLILNHGALDIDLQVKGDNDANLIRTDAANDLIGIGKSAPAHKLDVDGVGNFDSGILSTGLITAATGISLQRNTPATTTDKLYNVGGALYFNGSAVDGDTTYTASTGLTLVGTQFSTSGTGLFSHIQFGEASGTITAPIRIGNSVGGSDYSIAIGYKALEDIAATTTSNIGIGYSAGDGLENTSQYNTIVGYSAAIAASGDSNTYLGPYAGTNQKADNSISLGYSAGYGASGNKNVYIGFQAGRNVNPGSNNIDITIDSDGIEEMDGLDNKLNIYNIIRGDASSKRIAIGNLATTDYTPDATLEVKPKEHTDIGLIVQGDTSHSANLTEWQNSSETVVASVAADGDIFTSGTVSATGGMVIDQNSKLIWTDDSVRIGTDAGVMGGLRNVCIGQYACNGSAGGEYNVGIGRYACGSVGGDHNVGISYQAGKDSDGDHNISLGYQAGYSMSATSDYNLCLGRNAGRSADGDFNVFLGTHAGYDSDGTRNIYIGYQAGFEADPGSNNIEIITNSVLGVTSTLDGLSNKINIENTIMGDTAANKIVIGTGTTAQTANYSPAATLEIKPKEATDAALIVHSSGLSDVFSVSGTNVSISGRLLGPISAPVLQDTNATVNVALSSGNYHEVELAAAVTKVIFKDGIAGQRFMVRFSQPAGANYTIAWTNVDVDEAGTGGTVSWAAGGTAPTMTATNGKADTYGFIQRSATTFDGFVVGQNI